jgi:hypothetical protein
MDIKFIYHRFIDWLKKSNLNLFQFVFYSVLFIFAGYKIANYYSEKGYVKKNYFITEGKIVKYDEIGIEPKRYLTYSYFVDGKLFKREIYGPNKIYYECLDEISLCDKKRFFVIYSKKHPERSLIDLTVEIQDIDNRKFPNNLSKFQ